jgi:hypothetical protein
MHPLRKLSAIGLTRLKQQYYKIGEVALGESANLVGS